MSRGMKYVSAVGRDWSSLLLLASGAKRSSKGDKLLGAAPASWTRQLRVTVSATGIFAEEIIVNIFLFSSFVVDITEGIVYWL